MKYSYKDILDKSKEGMDKELEKGVIIAGVYMHQTLGFPIDVFSEIFNEFENKGKQWEFYLNFRNKYPKAYEKTI